MAKKASSGGGGGGGGGGESSNTGLIVSLVSFVLLSIGLGVATYLGFSKQADFEKQAKDALAKEQSAKKLADERMAQLAALRVATGVASAEDQTTFSGLKGQYGSVIQSQLAALKDLPKWDPASAGAADKPPKTYLARIKDLEDEVKATKAQGDARAADLEGKLKILADELADSKTKHTTAQESHKKAQAEVVTTQQQKAAGSDEMSAKLKQVSEEKQKLELEKQDLDVKLSAEIKKANERAASKDRKLQELRERIGPLMERIDTARRERPELKDISELHDLLTRTLSPFSTASNDTPKGSITRIDRGTNVVYVNLGSADYVRPGLTFSVLPAGSTGKAATGRDRKGAIEIVSVLEPHLSSAKIVDAPLAIRDPLLPGDLLFNPAWNASNRQHVALAGIFDLNGDGQDDTQDLIRTLERAGVVVDAYLDLKDRSIKGPGMTERTTFLIVGETPRPSSAQPLDSNNPIQAALLDLLTKQADFEKKAQDLGVEKVNYKRFLSMIGYKLPKTGALIDASRGSYLRGDSGKIKEGANPAAAPESPK